MYYEYKKIKSHFSEIEVGISINPGRDTLLLLHGFNDSKETFVFLNDFLSREFSLIGMDFRGHGGSDWNSNGLYYPSDNLLDLHTVTSQLLPPQFFIIAHSMGAGIAARYCGLFPERVKGLICLEGFSGLQKESFERERIRTWLENMTKKTGKKEVSRRKMTEEDATQKLANIYNHLSPEKIKKILPGLIRPYPGGGVVWKNDPRLKSISPIPFPSGLSRELWKNILCPTLMIYGGNSHLKANNIEEIKSHFKNLSYREIPESTHNMHHDNPGACIELMREFFSNHFGLMRY